MRMKNFLLAVTAAALLISCKKTGENSPQQFNDTLQKIDSINAARTKYNDSIKILNSKNRFEDLSGSHKLKFSSDGAAMSGTVKFTNKGKDLYDISGDAKSGSNTLNIHGTIKRVSEIHLNFEGKISQKINGSSYTRTKKTTLL